jgi:crotonobetainyl-CoA:carnitine CoA-transferase CaiB-like acyl-CoA transferase
MAILAALYRRSSTGEGARTWVPLFESQLSWLANRAQEYLVSGEDPCILHRPLVGIRPR